jgi:hypothetical protein
LAHGLAATVRKKVRNVRSAYDAGRNMRLERSEVKQKMIFVTIEIID